MKLRPRNKNKAIPNVKLISSQHKCLNINNRTYYVCIWHHMNYYPIIWITHLTPKQMLTDKQKTFSHIYYVLTSIINLRCRSWTFPFGKKLGTIRFSVFTCNHKIPHFHLKTMFSLFPIQIFCKQEIKLKQGSIFIIKSEIKKWKREYFRKPFSF